MDRLRGLLYRINRRLIGTIISPRRAGIEPDQLIRAAEGQGPGTRRVDGEPPPTTPLIAGAPPPLIYVLETRSLSDLIVLDLVTEEIGLPGPLLPIDVVGLHEQRRFFFLNRASHGAFRRNTMSDYSQRMVHLFEALADAGAAPVGAVVPVGIYWGRAPGREGSLLRLLFSEDWAVTSRLKRMMNLLLSRRDIVLHFGEPLTLMELASGDGDAERLRRRAARLLRVRLRNQRVATMGPDLSHRRTLTHHILQSPSVRAIIEAENDPAARSRLEQQARSHAREIASNLSYPTIRVLEHLLRWLWNRIYQGVTFHGRERLMEIAEGHTLVYVPSHRSHLDYLLLSYLLFQHGLMIPHIAAGENLDLPVLGSVLRRGGAFFMRRSFRDDPLYAAVFSEYLYQVYRRGHSVEFFPEGGRTRTGRLLPARLGLLKMTLEHHLRGVPRPLALVPVYFGYERLVEARSYLAELKGGEKKRESLGDLVASIRLLREDLGMVDVKIGAPLILDQWVRQQIDSGAVNPAEDTGAAAALLGREVMTRINAAAAINPVNMIALVILCMPRLAIEERTLRIQLACYLDLIRRDRGHRDYALPEGSPQGLIARAEELDLLDREHHESGDILSLGPMSAILMTWYRNNTAHVLALASLIACLIRDRRRPIQLPALQRMTDTVFPYIAEELQAPDSAADTARWVDHMLDTGLLVRLVDGALTSAPVSTTEHSQLRLLASLVMPTLERLYIVMETLASGGQGQQTRASLQARSHRVAQKMSRLYGLNAPEFFDARLFNQFVDLLINHAVVSERDDDTLVWSSIVTDVLRASESVIDADFRCAVRQEDGLERPAAPR